MAEYNINIDRVGDDLNEAYDLGYESCMRDYHIKHSNEQKTNADRIRAMTDEELAKWISGRKETCPPIKDYKCSAMHCYECWLAWMRKEAISD